MLKDTEFAFLDWKFEPVLKVILGVKSLIFIIFFIYYRHGHDLVPWFDISLNVRSVEVL